MHRVRVTHGQGDAHRYVIRTYGSISQESGDQHPAMASSVKAMSGWEQLMFSHGKSEIMFTYFDFRRFQGTLSVTMCSSGTYVRHGRRLGLGRKDN